MESIVKEAEEIIAKGSLSYKRNEGLRRVKDIAKVFGVPLSDVMQGFKPKGAVAHPCLDKTLIWWPKESVINDEKACLWRNEFDGNNTLILEWHTNSRKNQQHIDKVIMQERDRIVFKGELHSVHGWAYRYLGVFTLDIAASRKESKVVWRRKDAQDPFLLK